VHIIYDEDLEMSARIAFLMPGQGAYLPGRLAWLIDRYDLAAQTLREIDDAARMEGTRPISSLLLDSTAPDLNTLVEADPTAAQLAVFAASLTVHAALTAAGVRADALVGHSLGEITALTAAGGFTIADGTRLLMARARVATAVQTEVGGMMAIDLDAGRTEHLLAGLGDPRLAIAADNSLRQTIVSGPDDALAVLQRVGEALGRYVTRLRVSFPSHHPLLATMAEELHAQIAHIPQHAITQPVFSPILGRWYQPADDLREAVCRALVDPVGFRSAVLTLHSHDTRVYVECGLRSTLTKLAADLLPSAVVVAPFPVEFGNGTDFESSVNQILSATPSTTETRRAVVDRQPMPNELVAALQRHRRDQLADTKIAQEASAGTRSIVDRQRETSPSAPVIEDRQPESSSGAPAIGDRASLLKDLQHLFAEVLEYPDEVLTEDAALEADLGVDSLKQTDLLGRVLRKYGLPETAIAGEDGQYSTLGELADLLMTTLTVRA
jgi:[acyl-carrier-protein] S-malonyltransferase